MKEEKKNRAAGFNSSSIYKKPDNPTYRNPYQFKPGYQLGPQSIGSDPYTQKMKDQNNILNATKSQKSGVDYQIDNLGLTEADFAHMAKSGHTIRDGNIWRKDPDDDTPSWYETIGNQLGSEGFLGGLKGWIGLGTKALDAYTGYQQVGLAREQNELGRDAFSFQKAAWNKDYDARKIAYNTNARDVNAWKAAQTPGGYVMSELVV